MQKFQHAFLYNSPLLQSLYIISVKFTGVFIILFFWICSSPIKDCNQLSL